MKQAVGIDVAKDTFMAADNAQIRKFPNSEAGVREFLSWVEPTRDTAIGLEATGVYHLTLCLTLVSYGYQPILINPTVVKRYTPLSVRPTKTDRVDAVAIRDAVAAGAGYPFVDTEETVALHALIATRSGLCATRQALKGRMHAHQKRQEAVGIPLPDYHRPVLKAVDEQIAAIEAQLASYAPDTQALLRSIPGIGKTTAAVLVSVVGDISRFPTHDQFVAFVGIDPTVHESGTSVSGRRSITKRGNTTLRHMLYQCAFVAVRNDTEFAHYYTKKKREGKHHKAIIIALERKLCARIYAVWTRGTPFVKAA